MHFTFGLCSQIPSLFCLLFIIFILNQFRVDSNDDEQVTDYCFFSAFYFDALMLLPERALLSPCTILVDQECVIIQCYKIYHTYSSFSQSSLHCCCNEYNDCCVYMRRFLCLDLSSM